MKIKNAAKKIGSAIYEMEQKSAEKPRILGIQPEADNLSGAVNNFLVLGGLQAAKLLYPGRQTSGA